jgi:hypothetical protein
MCPGGETGRRKGLKILILTTDNQRFQYVPSHIIRTVILFITWRLKPWCVWPQVRLNPGETKNDEPRVIPLSDMMMWFFKNKLPRVCDYVFTYNGKQLTSIHTGWTKTVKALSGSYSNLLVHDLRRSAIRNMVRSGVPERVPVFIWFAIRQVIIFLKKLLISTRIWKCGVVHIADFSGL